MASRIYLDRNAQWRFPFIGTQYRNEPVVGKPGNFPIIAKGNIIEGIEAKE
jgi:hypothetical protein